MNYDSAVTIDCAFYPPMRAPTAILGGPLKFVSIAEFISATRHLACRGPAVLQDQ